jgi:exodeoxyribonuclease-5
MKLSPQQETAFNLIQLWLDARHNNKFVLSGYAGTGKTTLAKHIADTIGQENVVFCAYTGKAATVLRDKGCENSGTIHSFLYKYETSDDTGKPVFTRIPREQCAFYQKQLVICDEYSMLPEDIINDLLHCSRKILFLGDNFQLPPVRGECSLKPDFMLTDIQRQALDSGIIRAATKIRTENKLDYIKDPDFIYLPKSKIDKDVYMNVEQLICGRNKTRVDWNGTYREKLFGKGARYFDTQIKDKVICLKNNRDYGVYNGLIGNVNDINYKERWFGIKSDEREWYLPYSDVAWMQEKPEINHITKECVFDYAYAITCHKSQGSEFKSILVNNECFGDTHELRRRWTYTAITRARELCYLVELGT